MELHQLQVNRGLKKKKRIGRGGKLGTYSGRGIKGQKARSGARFEPIIRPLIKRYHKLKGASFISAPKAKISAEVNLSLLEKHFQAGETVSPQSLVEKSIISTRHQHVPVIKVLSDGELTKKLIFDKCSLSEAARKKIMEAGGEIISEPAKRGKKTKKQLSAEEIQEQQAKFQERQAKQRAAKKKAIEKRRKEARKSKGKKK